MIMCACEVGKPLVYFNQAPKALSTDWLTGVQEIKSAGQGTQNGQWKGSEYHIQLNTKLHEIAKRFFSEKLHESAVFIPYWVTVNQTFFTNPKTLPIDYFYRLLVTDDKCYSSQWSLDPSKSLDIWNQEQNVFKTVFYGFMEKLISDTYFGSGLQSQSGGEIKLPYDEIKLHNAPFIYWLGIPDDIVQLSEHE